MANYIRILNLAAASLLAALLSSCISEPAPDGGSSRVTFAAAIGRESKVDTRAGITFTPVQGDYRDIPFYIKAEVATASSVVYERAQYMVAPGTMGRLSAQDGQEEILWYNRKDSHTFYAWTMPWQEDEEFATDPDAASEVSFLPSTYQNMESLSSGERVNCGVMEHFIAAKTHPLTYNINGELVEMYFQHLVSRININATRLIGEPSNSNSEEVDAYMTFVDMPQKGIFYRRPDDGSAPCVEKVDDPTGVTCWIGNRTTTLYVCPGVDFSNMRFAIHFNEGNGNRGDYYGDFKSVIFKRPDEDLGNWDDGKSPTVLYAGEEMTINLVMRNNDVPNFTVNINPWTDVNREGTSHAKKGIYTLTEYTDIYNKFAGGNYSRPEDVDEIFALFGTEDENGDKVIYMYEDITTTHSRLPLDQSLILDGLGHVLTIENSKRTVNGTEYEYCARTPCCRNIFLTNGDGEHMIYIDENYQIYTVNPDTLVMTPTGNELTPRPLSSSQGSYYIDYVTGKVVYISSQI